jgi:rubrerythrin
MYDGGPPLRAGIGQGQDVVRNAMKHWTADDIPWDCFDPTRVDSEILRLVKAAAMVEKNSGDYATYLKNVFPDDDAFAGAVDTWAKEEVQHGDVLGRWAETADPCFNFADRFRVFKDGFKIPVDATASVRGSRSGELVARCVVEVGTSSYYTSLAVATDEPVLKAIFQRIAADEFRHYKLFYKHLKRYLEAEKPSTFAKLRVAFERIVESDDDELAYAYYAANGEGEGYDRRRCADAYAMRAYRYYRPAIVERGIAMTFKAAGFNPHGRLARVASSAAWRFMGWRRKRLAQLAA